MEINLNEIENNTYTFGINPSQQVVMTYNKDKNNLVFDIITNPQTIVVHEDYDITHQLLEKMRQHTKEENQILLLNEASQITNNKNKTDSESMSSITNEERENYFNRMRKEGTKWDLHQKYLNLFSEKYEDEENDFLNQDNVFYKSKNKLFKGHNFYAYGK